MRSRFLEAQGDVPALSGLTTIEGEGGQRSGRLTTAILDESGHVARAPCRTDGEAGPVGVLQAARNATGEAEISLQAGLPPRLFAVEEAEFDVYADNYGLSRHHRVQS